jgi:hypothetical protein
LLQAFVRSPKVGIVRLSEDNLRAIAVHVVSLLVIRDVKTDRQTHRRLVNHDHV